MISGYYCNKCLAGMSYLSFLKIGDLLSTPDQSGYFRKHTDGRTSSPANGVFFDTGTGYYQSGASQIGQSGFVEVEIGGGVNAYFNFGGPIGEIQFSGTAYGNSSMGKAVLINNPNYAHWFPSTGCACRSGYCIDCGRSVF
jgi:hypothetical protein